MSGKTVLITGATSGLGLATALLLAEQGAEVVMVGRDRTRGNFMRAEIAKCAGSVPILFLADLSSQAEIHRLAEKLHGSLSRIIKSTLCQSHEVSSNAHRGCERLPITM